MVRIFVGNLPMDTLKDDIERLFRVFGSVLTVEVKRPAKPPAFAFVEMAEGSNAKDTIASLDGTDFQGSMLRVELSKASLPNNGFNRTRSRGGPRPGNYRLIVEGLPRFVIYVEFFLITFFSVNVHGKILRIISE
eukprot:TRINITY_DN1692_c0_g1_i2.p1 TRINITY_DN1692_c0_g1~~TRINITY_DN1692_c0_g1_i2.p1  ORF type:complete len:135 (-),score=13.48 TRINITY_DN1692_c0_g1_i2:846-1250(-)